MNRELELVQSAERTLLDPAVRGSRTELDQLLDAEFVEIGASGRIWNRDDLIADVVASPRIAGTAVAEMSARHVTEDVIVVEYATSTPAGIVRRSSWWRRRDGVWRCYFHQGTVIVDR